MSLLFMFAGLGFGCVMFIMFVGAILIHFTYESPSDEKKRLWLASLTPAERAAYDRHERRKKEFMKLVDKRNKVANRIRREWYYARNPDWQYATHLWAASAAECGGHELFASYRDIWDADDCPLHSEGDAPDYEWMPEPLDPPEVPKGVWNPRTGKVACEAEQQLAARAGVRRPTCQHLRGFRYLNDMPQ